MNNSTIKKLLAAILSISIIFAMGGCSGKTAASEAVDTIQSLTTKDDAQKQNDQNAREDASEPEQPLEQSEAPKEDGETIPGPEGRYSDEEILVEYKKYSEMEYSRPDLDAFTAAADHAVELLESDASYEEICEALDAYEIECGHFNTMYVLAEIRSYQDMTDEFYAEEYAWVEENQAIFCKVEDHMFYAAAANEYVDRLEEEYFWEGFAEEYADETESMYTDNYMELDKQESALLTEYRNLIAAPTILYHGEERDVNELLEELAGMDYLMALEKYYNKYNAKLADVYIRLIKVRNLLAQERGYDSYEQMQYEATFERDYSPEDTEVLIGAVRDYILPAFEKINSRHSYYDVDYFEVPEDFLVSVMDAFTGNMGGDIRAAFEFMRQYELYDVSVSTKKADMSFETYIDDYESPFILSDCCGDSEDIMTFAHEFGHFCKDYVCYGVQTGIDVQEIFSQAMEYLCMFYLDSDTVTEDELYNLLLMKLLDVNGTYAQVGYAEFEHRIYSMNPDKLTADKINDTWLEICREYDMSEEGYEYLYRMMWIDIPHFFEYPFYVISYTVSNEVALQLFELESQSSGDGLKMYESMLLSDSDGLLALIEECGLEEPFNRERVKKSAEFLLNISEKVL